MSGPVVLSPGNQIFSPCGPSVPAAWDQHSGGHSCLVVTVAVDIQASVTIQSSSPDGEVSPVKLVGSSRKGRTPTWVLPCEGYSCQRPPSSFFWCSLSPSLLINTHSTRPSAALSFCFGTGLRVRPSILPPFSSPGSVSCPSSELYWVPLDARRAWCFPGCMLFLLVCLHLFSPWSRTGMDLNWMKGHNSGTGFSQQGFHEMVMLFQLMVEHDHEIFWLFQFFLYPGRWGHQSPGLCRRP